MPTPPAPFTSNRNPLKCDGPVVPVQSRDIAAKERYDPVRCGMRQADQAEQRGLAGTAGTHEKMEAAGCQREIDFPQDGLACAVAHAHALQPQDGCTLLVQAWPRACGSAITIYTFDLASLDDLQPTG
jgi:hypothetical protein